MTIRNLRVRGFESGPAAEDGAGWTIEGCGFSGNFNDPDFGWGNGKRNGGAILTRISKSVIRGNTAHNVWNGLDLWECGDNLIEKNDFSHCSNVCLKMWNSCRNRVLDNNLSYGLRIKPGEVHARDSTCVLIESGSDENRFERNDITHGGIVIVGGSGSRTLIADDFCHHNGGGGIVFHGDLATRGGRWKMYHLVVQGNRLEKNKWGIFGRFADRLFLAGNRFSGNDRDEFLEDVGNVVRGRDGLAFE